MTTQPTMNMANDHRTQRIAELRKEAQMYKYMGNKSAMFACWRQIDSMGVNK